MMFLLTLRVLFPIQRTLISKLKIEAEVEVALRREMPKYTWKSRDVSSVVENFLNIVYDIVKKHCFVEPTNPEQKRPKTENKDVVLERLKRQKKILRKQARRMKKKNQNAGPTLKELYKVIRAHSDYVKLSNKSSEKVDTQKQKESSSNTHGNLERKYWME